MKKVISVILSLVMLLGIVQVVSFAAGGYWTDSGNYDTSWYSDDKAVFEISTAEQLAGVAALMKMNKTDFYGKTLSITANIDLAAHEWVPIGQAKYGDNIPHFRGMFLGNGNKISNMTVSKASKYVYAGLFGLADACIIKDITVQGNVESTMYAAILCAAGTPVITNCRTGGTVVSDSHAAGILSYAASDTSFTNCVNYADIVSNGYYAAGILGSGGREFLNCSNFGSITTNYSEGMAGGIVAYSGSAIIVNCCNQGEIIESVPNGYYSSGAGISAAYDSTIVNCLNAAPVSTAFKYRGTVCVDENSNPQINNCFSVEGAAASHVADVAEKLNEWAASQPDSKLIARWNLEGNTYPVPELFSVEVTVNGEGGSVSPSGIVTCKMGEDITLTAVPDKGYHYTHNATVDGASVTVAGDSYTFENINEMHSFGVGFEKCSYVEASRTDPTSDTDGSVEYVCSVCGDSYTQVIEATGTDDPDLEKAKTFLDLLFKLLELVMILVGMYTGA